MDGAKKGTTHMNKIQATKKRIDQLEALIAKLEARDDFWETPILCSRSAGVCLVAKLRLQILSHRLASLVEAKAKGVASCNS